jgi:hypothetical protein
VSRARLKNIPVFIRRKSVAYLRRPVPERGALAIVTNVGAGAVDVSALSRALCMWTNGVEADGEVVWSGRPDAGVKLAMMSGVFLGIVPATVTTKPGRRGATVI